MSLPVQLHPDLSAAAVGDEVELTGDEAQHAVAVRRLRVGERLQLTDGVGTAAVCEITETVPGRSGRARLTARVDQLTRSEPATPSVTVVQALPKGDRGELAVEVLTEIGVDRVVPWAATRCVANWRGERAEKGRRKWAATAREAAKQSRRVWFPEVAPLARTEGLVDLVANADLAVVLHEEATDGLAALVPPVAGVVVVVVGPEGGITPEELDHLAAAGARPVRLGAEVLRTSTAGVAACAALLARTGRWADPASPGASSPGSGSSSGRVAP